MAVTTKIDPYNGGKYLFCDKCLAATWVDADQVLLDEFDFCYVNQCYGRLHRLTIQQHAFNFEEKR